MDKVTVSNETLILALRDRRAQVEAQWATYGARVSMARAEFEALSATIELFEADSRDIAESRREPAACTADLRACMTA